MRRLFLILAVLSIFAWSQPAQQPSQTVSHSDDITIPLDDGSIVIRNAHYFIQSDGAGLPDLHVPQLSFTLINHTSSAWTKVTLTFEESAVCNGKRHEWDHLVTVPLHRNAEPGVATTTYHEDESPANEVFDCRAEKISAKLHSAENQNVRIDGFTGKRTDLEKQRREEEAAKAAKAEADRIAADAQKKKDAEGRAIEDRRIAAEEQGRKEAVEAERLKRIAAEEQEKEQEKEDGAEADRLIQSNQDPLSWRKTVHSLSTLKAVRAYFVNRRVIVSDAVVTLSGRLFLLDWKLAEKNGDRYSATRLQDPLAATYRGQTATVVAVQLNESKRRPNVLGEIVPEDETIDPYFDLVVQFDNGTLAILTTFAGIITDQVELRSVSIAVEKRMSTELPLLVGKNVYAVGYTKLYMADTTLEEMNGPLSFSKQLSHADIPLLAPLRILAAKYIQSVGVILKVKLPSDQVALSLTEPLFYLEIATDSPFFKRVAGDLLVEIPKTLTPKDVNAIRDRTIYKGMKRESVVYLLGFPDKENDWGSGGKQLIFGKSLFVYLDRSERVMDWQSLDRE